jgi:MoaA/NifB/PqqE/SkfB family radical SAM enzyme
MNASLNAGLQFLKANFTSARSPFRAHMAVTYRCNSRCRTCNVWKATKSDKLTADEMSTADYQAFFRANPQISCLSLTGGEPFLREDLVEIIRSAALNVRGLYAVNITTNGLLTDRVVSALHDLLQLDIPKIYLVVSIDGTPSLHDAIRGVDDGFVRSTETLRRLLPLRGDRFDAYAGMTVSPINLGQVEATMHALERQVPGLDVGAFSATMAHRSSHYYMNPDMDLAFQPEAIEEIGRFFSRHRIRSSRSRMERIYRRYSVRYAKTGQCPIRCRAADISSFIDPRGFVYPCHIDSECLGSLREHDFSLRTMADTTIWKRTRKRIASGTCRQCWTPCGAMDSLVSQLWRLIY